MFTKKEIIISIISTISLLVFSHHADAKTLYHCGDKQVSKGQAIKLLVSGQVKECLETRKVIFNESTGGLKSVK